MKRLCRSDQLYGQQCQRHGEEVPSEMQKMMFLTGSNRASPDDSPTGRRAASAMPVARGGKQALRDESHSHSCEVESNRVISPTRYSVFRGGFHIGQLRNSCRTLVPPDQNRKEMSTLS